MSTASVQQILQEIEALSPAEQLAIEEELARRLEQHWQEEAQAARGHAQARGIDQAAIDRAVERQRYGR